jgi:hypothetical protein
MGNTRRLERVNVPSMNLGTKDSRAEIGDFTGVQSKPVFYYGTISNCEMIYKFKVIYVWYLFYLPHKVPDILQDRQTLVAL